MRFRRQPVAPGRFRDAEVLQHHLRPQPTRGHDDRGAAVRADLVRPGPGETDRRDLGQVVEDVDPVVVGVVPGRAVGDLDDEPARVADHQAQRVVRGDQVGVDRQPQRAQAVVQRVLPHRGLPLDQQLAAPDVVDQDVQPAVGVVDALHQRPNGVRVEVVARHRDAGPARCRDQLGGLLDRLRPSVLGRSFTGRAAGAVHRRAGGAELDGDAAARAARRPGHERDPAGQVHGVVVHATSLAAILDRTGQESPGRWDSTITRIRTDATGGR